MLYLAWLFPKWKKMRHNSSNEHYLGPEEQGTM